MDYLNIVNGFLRRLRMGKIKHISSQSVLNFNTLVKKQILENNSGTSIIEVIIGMVILAMLVAGLNAGVLSLVNTNKSSKEIAAASNFGYEKLEEIRRVNYSNIEYKEETREGNYLYSVAVTRDPDDTQRTVAISIMWPSTDPNPKHQIALSTIIAKP
jgi:Tfp pilus assembly protein PilV